MNIIGSIYIIDIGFDSPPDITVLPQTYTVSCTIAGNPVTELDFHYDDVPNVKKLITDNICTTSDGFSCTTSLDNGDDDTGVSGLTSDITPDPLRHGLLTVTWEAEEISSGAFRQDNNNGDHRIRCYAKRNNVERTSDYITVRGNVESFTIL